MRIAILTTDMREAVPGCTDPQPRIGIAPEALLQGFVLLPEVEVHVVSCLKEPLPSPKKIAPNIFYHGVTVPRIGWLRTGYQGCIRAVRKKLREIQPDIVHGQGTERDCAISAAFSGFPNVVTVHGNMRAIAEFYRARPGSFFWLASKLELVALKKTGGVFCNSAYTEKLVAPRVRRVWRVANALRLPFFENSPTSIRQPILLNVGVMEPRKQQIKILELAHNLWRSRLKFGFYFIGNHAPQTKYGRAFSRQLADAERDGYARHLGILDAVQLISVMDKAVAMVHFPTEESFGLVVAEALARNLKFFGAATGGVVDIAAGVEGAELFATQDWTALENAITQWLAVGCPPPPTAVAIMRERYHPAVIARRHVEIYREVLAL